MQPASASPDRVIHDLSHRGWSVTPHFLPQHTVDRLAAEGLSCLQGSKPRAAGGGNAVDVGATEDFILWLQEATATTAQREYLQRLEELRLAVNTALALDLQPFEGHLAAYPPGGYYHKHKDNFEDEALRALTCILYLNNDWEEEDGGQLRLYLDDEEYSTSCPAPARWWHSCPTASGTRCCR
jgi:SM-20-related protein